MFNFLATVFNYLTTTDDLEDFDPYDRRDLYGDPGAAATRSGGMVADYRRTSPMVDNLVGAIRNLTSEQNYKTVSSAVHDVTVLRDQNRSLAVAHRQTLEEYRHIRNELDSERAELESCRRALEEAIAKRGEDYQEIVASRVKLASDLHDTNHQLEGERRRVQQMDQQIADLRRSYDRRGAEVHALEEAQRKTERQLKGRDDALEASNRQITDMSAQMRHLQQSLEERHRELGGLASTRDRMEADLADHKERLQRELGSRDSTSSQIAELNQHLTEKTRYINELEAVKIGLDSALAESHNQLQQEAKVVKYMTEEIGGLKKTIEDKNRQLSIIEGNKVGTEGNIDVLRLKLDDEVRKREDMVEEISGLHQTIDEKIGELSELRDQRTGLQKESTDAKTLLEEERAKAETMASKMEELLQTVKTKSAEADRLTELVRNAGERAREAAARADEMNANLESASESLQAKSNRVEELESFMVELGDDAGEDIIPSLDKIWTDVHTLVHSYMFQDLDETVLADPSCWAHLRGSEYLRGPLSLPIPQTNSETAKRMRTSAVLAAVSRAMKKYLFCPTYFGSLEDDAVATDDVISQLLRDLYAKSPPQELHMRASLMAALPIRQEASIHSRCDMVAGKISLLIGSLIPPGQVPVFRAELERVCNRVQTEWGRIQRSQAKIEPYYDPMLMGMTWHAMRFPEKGSRGDFDELTRCSTAKRASVDYPRDDVSSIMKSPTRSPAPSERKKMRRGPSSIIIEEETGAEAGMDRVTIASSRDDGDGYHSREPKSRAHSVIETHPVSRASCDNPGSESDPEDLADLVPVPGGEICLVVWPTFCVLNGGEASTLTQGMVVTKEQAHLALEEIRSASSAGDQAGQGMKRLKNRTMTMPLGRKQHPGTPGAPPAPTRGSSARKLFFGKKSTAATQEAP